MSPDLQTLANQYALSDQSINGASLPAFDSFTPASAAPPTTGRLFTEAPAAFADSSIAAWSGVPWTKQIEEAALSQGNENGFRNDGTWITAPDGSTFAVADILAGRSMADLASRNQQYKAGTLAPDAVPWVNTADYGSGAGIVTGSKAERFGPAAFGLQNNATVEQMTQATGLDIPGQMRRESAANSAVIGKAAQDEAIGRIKDSLPDVSGLKPNMNLDGSINYDWMVQWATGKATKPAWADQYEQAWDTAVQDFTKEAQQPSQQQQLSQALSSPASSPASSPSGASMASALRSMAPQASQSSSDPLGAARQDWATWGAGQGDYAKPSWWGGVRGGEFAPIALEEPAAGSPEAMSQEAPFNPVYQPSTATTAPGFTTSAAMGLANSNGMYQPTYGANAGNMPSVSTSDNSGVPNYTDIGGIVGAAIPVPGLGLAGRGIGAAFDIGGANSQLEKQGLKGDLGVIDWGKAVWPEWAGGTNAQQSMANSVFDQGFAGSYTTQGLQSVSPLGTRQGSQGTLLQTITSPFLMAPGGQHQ
jgi:hypothetical protein